MKLKIDEGNVFEFQPDGTLLPEGDAPLTAKEYQEVEISPNLKYMEDVRSALYDLDESDFETLEEYAGEIADYRRKEDRLDELKRFTEKLSSIRKTLKELRDAIGNLEDETIKVPVELVMD